MEQVMANDVYLHIDGIRGASTDERHKGWIECTSVNWNGERPKSGSCEHMDIVISKLADLASPILLQACSSGDTIPKAKFEFMRADRQGVRVRYLEIEIENVLIGAVSPTVDEGDNLSERIGFKFSKVKGRYAQQ